MAIPVKYLRQDENASPLISSVRLFNTIKVPEYNKGAGGIILNNNERCLS